MNEESIIEEVERIFANARINGFPILIMTMPDFQGLYFLEKEIQTMKFYKSQIDGFAVNWLSAALIGENIRSVKMFNERIISL